MAEYPPVSVNVREDPLYLNARREAIVILALWSVCFVYTVTCCYLLGYLSHEAGPAAVGPDIAEVLGPLESFNRTPESLEVPLGLGMPDWVFWGIALPWLASIVVTIIFCTRYFVEDDLGRDESDTGAI